MYYRYIIYTFFAAQYISLHNGSKAIKLLLFYNKDRSERENKFWNASTVEMKFSVEKVCLKGLLKTSQIMEWEKWIPFTRRLAVTNLNLPDPLSTPLCGS